MPKLTIQQIRHRIDQIEFFLDEIEHSDREYKQLVKELDKLVGMLHRAQRTQRAKMSKSDREWQSERAMEAGMLHGCDAYNEVMGY